MPANEPRKPRQLTFPSSITRRRPRVGAHGGWRNGAGRRPATGKAGSPHTARPRWRGMHPVHVTWRIVSGLPSLRSRKAFRVIRQALSIAAERFGMTIVEFSVQSNHLHMIIEAIEQPHMSRGMQGLGVRISRNLNRVFGRRGTLLAERFHAHVLRSRSETINAVRYVRTNHLHHRGVQNRRRLAVAASMFPRPHGDRFSTNDLHHGVSLRFARSYLLTYARNQLALPD